MLGANRLIGLDGLHRTGKGTQAELLEGYLERSGHSTVTMRGDGTRPGEGVLPGDPLDVQWQERCRDLKGKQNTVEGWNEASYLLVKELVAYTTGPSQVDTVLVDRTVLSRATFLLDRGVFPAGDTYTFEELYPDHDSREFDIEQTVPDVIFDLQADHPDLLLARLDVSDPKYEFRARNIRHVFKAAQAAKDSLPSKAAERVVTIDAIQEVGVVQATMRAYLQMKSLA